MSEHNDLDLLVLIPTYNRAGELRQTLEYFTRVDRSGLAVEIVIIDNNSVDNTRYVVSSYEERLPLRYLFAPSPGKNRALNFALEKTETGRIVVFTDDDIVPARDWFQRIEESTRRWPGHSVFGGRIDVLFPDRPIPQWTEVPLIRKFAFAEHHISDREEPYPPGQYPFGPNYWVRREIFEKGYRFDESIGPHPTRRILGDEILFLKKLADDGYEIVYIPGAVVGHRIQPEMLSPAGIRKRAVTLGRGAPHVSGLCRPELLKKNPALWRCLRYGSMAWNGLLYMASFLSFSQKKRLERCVRAILNIWYNIESLNLAREKETRE